jgi:hypothetical protein
MVRRNDQSEHSSSPWKEYSVHCWKGNTMHTLVVAPGKLLLDRLISIVASFALERPDTFVVILRAYRTMSAAWKRREQRQKPRRVVLEESSNNHDSKKSLSPAIDRCHYDWSGPVKFGCSAEIDNPRTNPLVVIGRFMGIVASQSKWWKPE